MTYDNADRLTKVVNKKGNNTLSSFTFGSLDAVGNAQNLTKLLGGATTTTYYTYDPYDRLTGACNKLNCTGSGLTGLGYTYDPVGNRLTQLQYGAPNVTTTYKYDSDDKLCWAYVGTSSNACSSPPGGATIYTFEANGNETGAGSTTYAYDLENRMTSGTVSGTTTTYGYDGDGNRLSATTSGSTTSYLWDTNESLPLLALERSGGSTLRDYSYGVGSNSMTTGGANYYYLLDAFENVANMTSSAGATEWTYSYEPFGTVTATKNDPSAPTNPMQFDAQYLDAPTGLYDLRARNMDSSLARFVQQDPAPALPTAPYGATYLYGADNGVSFSDPSGLFPGEGLLKRAANDIWHPVRFALTAPGTVLGLEVAGVHKLVTGQGDCDWNGKEWVFICYNSWTVPGSNAFTLGSTINTSLLKSTFATINCGGLLAHETKHSDQWAILGPVGFPIAYGIDAGQAGIRSLLTGGSIGKNMLLERWAGLKGGGYQPCGC